MERIITGSIEELRPVVEVKMSKKLDEFDRWAKFWGKDKRVILTSRFVAMQRGTLTYFILNEGVKMTSKQVVSHLQACRF